MGMKRNLWLLIVFPAVMLIILWFVITSPNHTPVWKGREIALKYGCFNCHGFEGYGNVKNPGYRYSEVPSWQGETAMMFILNEEELKEWILYGKPRRLKDVNYGGVIKMPAYENIISENELKNLISYLKAVMGLIKIDNDAAKAGYEVAKKSGCFGCHGPYGMGGMPNKGSFKGYIPGWDGEDFKLLVENEDELKEWILYGEINRLEKNIIAGKFLRRQVVKMPAYKDILSKDEINYLVSYIRWLRGGKI